MDGIVFDTPGSELRHHVDAILVKYELNDPALRLLAVAARTADSHLTNPHSAGEGPGRLRDEISLQGTTGRSWTGRGSYRR